MLADHRIVSVTTAATNSSVAVLATVKTELGITDSASDTQLSRIITAVGAAFAGALGLQRPPWRQTYQETLEARGGEFPQLSRWPIESGTSGTSSGSTVDSTTYSIAGADRDRLYRDSEWDDTSGELDYVVTYVAGYLMPGEISDWAASTAYTVTTDWVRSTTASDVLRFQATTGGTSDSTEPTWPTSAAGTVTDNTVVWTAREATELPEDLQEAAILQTIQWFRGALDIPVGVSEEKFGPSSIKYSSSLMTGSSLSPAVEAIVRSYR